MEDTNLPELVSKRAQLKTKLTRTTTFIKNIKDTDDINVIKARLTILQPLLSEFEDIQFKIEEFKLSDDATTVRQQQLRDLLKQADNERDQFETNYCNAVAGIQSILDKRSSLAKSSTSQTTTNNSQVNQKDDDDRLNVKLPALNLPHFSGSYKEFVSFHSIFNSIIHENNQLDNCRKFQYLKSCLKDEALRCIDSLAISSDNYGTAWDILKKRYMVTRLIVQEHVYAILNSPTIVKGSHLALRGLLDDITVNLEALKVLKLPVESWDGIVIPIITAKLDFNTKRDFESTLNNSKLPDLKHLIEFLEKRCQLFESLNSASNSNFSKTSAKSFQVNSNANNKSQFNLGNKARSSHTATNSKFNISCFMCKKPHSIYQCTYFLKLSIPDRLKQVTALKLCNNCLRNNHQSQECRSSGCRECNQKHNTLLHISNPDIRPEPISQNPVINHCMQEEGQVLLSTALVLIADYQGKYHSCRTLLDVGSQLNFVSESLCKNLGLRPQQFNMPITGVNQAITHVKQAVSINIKSRCNEFHTMLNCLVLPRITGNLPLQSFQTSVVKIPKGIILADPHFNTSSPIDLLIGAEHFWKLLCKGQIQLSEHEPHFQETLLGWVVGGTIQGSQLNSLCNLSLTTTQCLERQVAQFWDVEEINYPAGKMWTPEETACEQHFIETHKRDASGRFIVRLPFKDNIKQLGFTRDIALSRFYSLERKLSNNPTLKANYIQFIQEYQSLNHLIQIPHEAVESVGNYYFCHHPVIKENSLTTRLRVVFNGSAKSTTGISLNDTLMVGPTIQQELFSIIIRFRTHKYVLCADISKMYRQIMVHSDDQPYQKILWRDDPSKPITVLQLRTVTYGTACAPFIAVRCLHQLAFEEMNNFPAACKVILEDFYMDDVQTGANSFEEATELRDQLIEVLKRGGFELCKWSSNHPDLLPDANQFSDSLLVNLDRSIDSKTLGLWWNAEADELKYSFKSDPSTRSINKRNILSAVAQIFDPLGLISPITIRAKILLQKLWSLKLSWDESVPADIETAWLDLVNDLHGLNDIRISRNVISTYPYQHIELHGFCDASNQAYGACIYIRVCDSYGKYFTQLLCAKSRVAPLKTLTVPRLELCGAVLLAKLVHKITKILGVQINDRYFWTDSSIVLAWLSSPPQRWQTFVANRVSEIQSLTVSNEWHHIRTNFNPADVISRGLSTTLLIQCELYWHGPEWFTENAANWPIITPSSVTEINPPEQRKVSLILTKNIDSELSVFSKFSSFIKLERTIAYCLRFIHNCRNNKHKVSGHLSCHELRQSHNTIIKYVQKHEFGDDIKYLANQRVINKSSKLITLDPFLSPDGILRVGGRLRQADIAYNKKFPILLPAKHHVTNLLIKREHEIQLHAGPQLTLACLRQKYWPVSARNLVRNLIHKCVRCFRTNPKGINPKMGDLPRERLEPTRPFLITGVDYAGPMLLKRGRGQTTFKAYIAIFVCFSCKAVHLELVGELTAESFLAALQRFMSRRGKILKIYSDNGSNFVGANNQLKELFKSTEFEHKIINLLSTEKITWKFIPPKSPHMGGLWEAGVKSVKRHLKRVLGNALATYEEMNTILTRIEACLNSRPLTPLTNDPNDLSILTPGHFLIGESLTAPLELDYVDVPENRLSKWKRCEHLRQHFWRRWQREYLSQLQTRPKWKQHPPSANQVRVGAMVLLVEEKLPPLCWRLGRILQIHPGEDGIVRVVTVKTTFGLIKRATTKVCVLPLDNE